jgi:hypothetical protein
MKPQRDFPRIDEDMRLPPVCCSRCRTDFYLVQTAVFWGAGITLYECVKCRKDLTVIHAKPLLA